MGIARGAASQTNRAPIYFQPIPTQHLAPSTCMFQPLTQRTNRNPCAAVPVSQMQMAQHLRTRPARACTRMPQSQNHTDLHTAHAHLVCWPSARSWVSSQSKWHSSVPDVVQLHCIAQKPCRMHARFFTEDYTWYRHTGYIHRATTPTLRRAAGHPPTGFFSEALTPVLRVLPRTRSTTCRHYSRAGSSSRLCRMAGREQIAMCGIARGRTRWRQAGGKHSLQYNQ